jgi:hypothetical protein
MYSPGATLRSSKDYCNWKDTPTFQKQFRKLVEGLNLFYK